MTCIFCNIVHGDVPAKIVFEDNDLLAFYDLTPQTPVHLLIIPKLHISTINDTEDQHEALLGKMIITAKKIATQEGLSESGYRLVFNVNKHGGQAVYHIHLHLLGGRQLTWPPG